MTTIEDDIAAWAATRPTWQQAALCKLAKGHVFTPAEVAAIASELEANSHQTVAPLKATDVPGAQSAGATVSLRSVGDVTNVNALLASQVLTFAGTGLTVVYGDNGSGKSGYARLIKDAVGARHVAPVHSNVFEETRGGQRAAVEFACGDVQQSAVWPDAVDAELRAVSFYDEACGDAYVGGESELTYRPAALLMLDGLIGVCDAVGSALSEDLRANELARSALPAVAGGTPAAQLLEDLSGTTTAGEIDSACAAPDDASEQVGALMQEEARLRSTDPARERSRLEALATKIKTISTHVSSLAIALSDDQVAKVANTRRNASELRAAAAVASSSSFDAEPVEGVGTETWRALWESARRFSEAEAYHEQHFPVTSDGARCVLCQQELSGEPAARLDRFEAFMQDTTAQQAEESESALQGLASNLRILDVTPPRIAGQLVEIESTDAALAGEVTAWLTQASERRTALLAQMAGSDDVAIPPLEKSLHSALDARAAELDTMAASIDAASFDASLADVLEKKDELQARLALAQHRPAVEAEIARLADRARIESAKRLTDTTGITRKTTELTEAHVTALVRDRFIRESDRLRLERIELKKTGGHKGKLRHRPSLLGAKTEEPVVEVLSEGEQTALGLAGYFTEAYFDATKSALVLDDPVTSLDHIRRDRVARRLAEFAVDRQVIVFTHDVAFVGALRHHADDQHVTFTERGVQRRGDNSPGLCTDRHPWKAKDVPRRLDELEQGLARIKRDRTAWDTDVYEKECSDWAGKLSETWERVINLEIVYALVDPGTSHVHPNMLKVLAKITDEDNVEFQQSYSRISGWARRHDKSPAVNYVPPEPTELEEELAKVKAWFARVKKYRN